MNPGGVVQGGYLEQVSGSSVFEVGIVPGIGSIALSWSPQGAALYYRVWCGLADDALSLVADQVTASAYTISGLRAGEQYFVQVTAVRSPRGSLPSVSGGLASQAVAVLVPSCTPLAADVCYGLIRAGAAPLLAGNASPGGGGPSPYAFEYAIDWSDDSECGYDVAVYPDFSILASIVHRNVPVGMCKQRRVRFTMQDDNRSSFVVISGPSAAGDAMPSGAYPNGTVIVIDFSSDCSGNLGAAVSMPDVSCARIQNGNYNSTFTDLGGQLDFPVDWSDTANLGHSAQSTYDANGGSGDPDFSTNIRFSNIPPSGTSCRVVQIGYPPQSQGATITCDPPPQGGNPVASYPFGGRYMGASIVFEAVNGVLTVESVQFIGQT